MHRRKDPGGINRTLLEGSKAQTRWCAVPCNVPFAPKAAPAAVASHAECVCHCGSQYAGAR
jgi:hypothetical protein